VSAVRRAREEVCAAIAALVQANLEVRVQFEENERLLRESLVRIELGASIEAILRALPAQEERTANIEAVRIYYEHRHVLRKGTIRAALDEGMPIAELAALYAVPHEVIASCAAIGEGSPGD
jgi:hypothetical protein